MRVLGIVPARGGSKRLPGKNLRLLAGKPLISWVIEAAVKATRIDRLVVSSDDDEILKVSRKHDPSLVLKRPSELADDRSPAIDYVRHALATVEADGSSQFDAVVILQPSSPLTWSQDIDASIDLFETTGADTVVSVVQIEHAIHPLKLKVMNGSRLLPYLGEEKGRMAEHELPKVFVRNCAVYATRRKVIDQGLVIGDDCRGYVMPRERSIDINEELDLMFAEFLLTKFQLNQTQSQHAVR
jgi:CMP-N,N'-diacetyllegionaminic acid synthase